MAKKGKKKGQAAMEFLMTYGWAILVVLAAIGALAYFGVLSPKNLLPSSCTVAAGFGCSESKATSNNISVKLRNNLGEDISAFKVSFGGDMVSNCNLLSASQTEQGVTFTAEGNCPAAGTCNMSMNAGGTLRNGKDIANFFANCPTALTGTASTDFTIIYTKVGETVNHAVSGKATLKVEQ